MKYLFLLLAFISTAHAALLIEPVVGYNYGTKLDFEDSETYSGGNGVSAGGRLGFQKLGFQLGIDYLNSAIGMDNKNFDKKVKMNEWAGFVGFEFPILFRVYGGLIFAGSGETMLNNDDIELQKLSGAKAGVGFTGLPFIDINFEYRRGTFSELRENGVKEESETKYQSLLMSLSLPFTL